MSTAIDKIISIIDSNIKKESFSHFVLQGGAGSGKTESLKQIIHYISENHPTKKIACITHTNLAADEIKHRVNNPKHKISTIHSFLNELIKNYKINLKEVLNNIFLLDESDISTHNDYKKRYSKLSIKKFQLNKDQSPKVVGKRDYDKNPNLYNSDLLLEIKKINNQISDLIQEKDYNEVRYNETSFDSLSDCTFSHDSLITISKLLSNEYPLFNKIISDKFDFIFVDEYQDTHPDIIELFLTQLPNNKNTTIGLFGDSMQGIYDEGIGSVNKYAANDTLKLIPKEDNYRCSSQVIDFINQLRDDSIVQSVAFKSEETINERQGYVKFYYSFLAKPSIRSDKAEKDIYLALLKANIEKISNLENLDNHKILLLTNKSIATELAFEKLYKIFDERYSDVKDEIEKDLSRIQITETYELLSLYKNKKYNELLLKCKKQGFIIRSLLDKNNLIESLEKLTNSDFCINEVIQYCIDNKLIKLSERHKVFNYKSNKFIQEFNENDTYQVLTQYLERGFNTISRIRTEFNVEFNEQEFEEFLKDYKKKIFFEELRSEKLKFNEVVNYFDYLYEDSQYITMHKTKGSGIENVFVVLEEFFWPKYNFKKTYDGSDNTYVNTKLFYVACSRAIKNLIIYRVIENDVELKLLKDKFTNCEFVMLE